ncbi:unnamed protein product [Tilletia controversa]|nr:unnamed protein product [Tilletia controversa]CAD6985008.1 unnamed protein product [Tilletia controversa]
MQPQVVQSHAQPTQAQAGPSSMQPPQPASRLPPAQKNTSQPQQGRSDVPQQSRQAQKQSHPPEVSSGESSTGAALFHDHNQQQNNAGNATAGGSSQAERPVPATRQLAEEQLTRWGFRYFLEGGIGVLICKACRCAVKNVRAHMRHHVLLGQLDALREVEAAELLRAAIKSGYPEHREISEASEAPIPDPKVMPISDLETGHGYCCTAENCNFVAFRFKDVIKHMKDTHPALPCDDPLFQPRYSVLQFWNNVERPFEVARGLLWYDPSMVRWPPDFSDDDTDLEWSPDKVPARSAETRAQSLLRRHGFAVIKKFKATVCVICRVAVKASEEGLFTHLKQMHLRLGPTASRLRAQEALAIIDRYFPDSFAPEQLDRPEVTSAPLPYLNIFSHGFACNGCNFTSAQQSATHLHMKKKHPTDGATMRKCREFQAWMKDGRGYRGYFQVNHNPDDPDGIRMRKDKGRALDGAAGTADGDDGPSAAAGPSASEGDGDGSGQTSAPATAGNPPPSVLPTESSAPGASGSAPGGLALGGLAGQTTQPISPATPPLALAGSSSAGPSASAIRSSPAGAVSALAVQQVDRIGISAASAMAAPTLQSNENLVPANRTTGTAVNGASSGLDKTAGQQSQSSAATLPIVNNGTGMASDVQTSATSSSTAILAASSAADASSPPATASDGPQGGGNAPAAAATSSAAPLPSASPASTGVTASKHGETPSTATGSGRTTQLHQVAASIAAPQASGSRYTGVSDDDYDDTMPLFQLASARSAALLGTAPNNFRKPTGKRASNAAKPGRGGSQAASGSKLVPYSSMPPRIAPTGRASLPARLPSRTTTQPASGPVADTVPPAVPAVSVGPATAPTTALQALVRSAARHAVVPRVMGRSSMPSGSSTVAGTETTGGFDAMQVEEEEEEEEPEDEEEEDQLVPPSEIARRLASLKFKPRSQSALTLWQLESEGASSFAPIRRDVSTSVLPTVSLPDDWDRSYSVLRLGPERDEIVLEGGTSIFAAEEDEGMPDVLAASASALVDQDASASADNEATANVGSARLHSTPTAVPVIQRGSSLEATGSASGSTSSALGPTPSAVQARRGAVAARGRKQQKMPSKPRPKSLLLSVQRGKAALKRKRAVGDVNGDEEEVDQLADDGDDEPEEEEESESQVDDEDDDETYEDSTANRGRINPGIISTRLRP